MDDEINVYDDSIRRYEKVKNYRRNIGRRGGMMLINVGTDLLYCQTRQYASHIADVTAISRSMQEKDNIHYEFKSKTDLSCSHKVRKVFLDRVKWPRASLQRMTYTYH